MGLLPLFPLAIVGVALGVPTAAAHLSAMSFAAEGVAVRNFPQRTRCIALSAIDRFDEVGREGVWSQVRQVRAYLLLNDGSRVIVRRCADPDGGTGVTALNNRLDAMRRAVGAS